MTPAALLLLLAPFVCPMHPDQQSDVAATCAICGMRMVKMPPLRFETFPSASASTRRR